MKLCLCKRRKHWMCSEKHCGSYCTVTQNWANVSKQCVLMLYGGTNVHLKVLMFHIQNQRYNGALPGTWAGTDRRSPSYLCVFLINFWLLWVRKPSLSLVTSHEDVTHGQEFSNKTYSNDFCKDVWDIMGGILQTGPVEWMAAKFWGWGSHDRGVWTFPLVFLSPGFFLHLGVPSHCWY